MSEARTKEEAVLPTNLHKRVAQRISALWVLGLISDGVTITSNQAVFIAQAEMEAECRTK